MALGRADKDFLIRVRADLRDAQKKMNAMEQSMANQERTAGKLGAAYKVIGPAIGALIAAL